MGSCLILVGLFYGPAFRTWHVIGMHWGPEVKTKGPWFGLEVVHEAWVPMVNHGTASAIDWEVEKAAKGIQCH